MPLVRKPVAATAPPDSNTTDVLKSLASKDPDERWQAARLAAQVPGSQVTAVIDVIARILLTESVPRVREALFTSLTRIGTLQSVDAILPLLRVDDANLRTGALDALRSMVSVVREHLPALLTDDDSDVRVLSCEIARGLPSEEATQLLCDLLAREHNLNVCAAAIEVLTEVGSPAALPTLAQCETRFRETPFLLFAITIAGERIASQKSYPAGNQPPNTHA
jgi:HEAT repeat protein